ncbi:MAG: hypothetical protein P4L41_14560 [Flavipsychrobacter sp.]|nr:hypothetical protein [Flavipsychrobacter sp.]
MKTIFYTVITLVLFSSCKTTKRLPDLQTPTKPYVLLKDGRKYIGTKVNEEAQGLVTNKITLDDKIFDSKDVAIFSPGDFTYANVNRYSFAPQVVAGKINVYRYQGASESYANSYNTNSSYSSESERSSSTRHLGYYIQDTDSGEVKRLSYKNLLPMVERGSPEYRAIKKYRRKQIITKVLSYTGTGLMLGGAIWAEADGSNTGLGLFVAGLVISIPSTRAWVLNEERLFGIVLSLDHYVPKKAFHKQVGQAPAASSHKRVN